MCTTMYVYQSLEVYGVGEKMTIRSHLIETIKSYNKSNIFCQINK